MSGGGAGELADELALRHRGPPVKDGDGGVTRTQAVYATVWALVEPATAAFVERVIGRQIAAPVLHIVKVYHLTETRVTDEATWTDRFGVAHELTVRGLRPDPDGVWLWLACEERLPANG